MRTITSLDVNRLFKTGIYIVVSINITILIAFGIIHFTLFDPVTVDNHKLEYAAAQILPFIIMGFNFMCTFLLLIFWRKNRHSRNRAGQEIISALDKMSKGDLGWKITLRRGAELANVADSVTKTRELLAERIIGLRMKAEEISEVQDFLYDSINCSCSFKPHTIKALRKLSICLSRLKADVDDFEISIRHDGEELIETLSDT